MGTYETLKGCGVPHPIAACGGAAASALVTVPADTLTQQVQVRNFVIIALFFLKKKTRR